MIQLAKCPKCLRKVFPGNRNGKKFAYDYIVNQDGEIVSWLPHSYSCPWSSMRDPLVNGRMKIKDYADILDEIQMIWKLDCAEIEPKPPIDWEQVDIYHQQPPLRHLNPITYHLVKPGGPYQSEQRKHLHEHFKGTIVNKPNNTVAAIIVELELFDKIHDFLYQYNSKDKKSLKPITIMGYRLLLDRDVPSEQKKYHYGI
ncbi:hypothetical protein JT359_10425 [Candidatus Poribacteria bacterium]|nr:hypothetical protein [Candidatus Poribacteria bacterium]